MRVEISEVIPLADSYGRSSIRHKVFPMKNHDEVNSCIEHFIRGTVKYKLGTQITINIREDWEYEG